MSKEQSRRKVNHILVFRVIRLGEKAVWNVFRVLWLGEMLVVKGNRYLIDHVVQLLRSREMKGVQADLIVVVVVVVVVYMPLKRQLFTKAIAVKFAAILSPP